MIKKNISQKLVEKTFKELGLNPKTGKPSTKSKLGNSRSMCTDDMVCHLVPEVFIY
jgi:hypothetical protein